MTDLCDIEDYHAHIYYRNKTEHTIAARIRENVEANYDVIMGRWHNEPVGPHPVAMYQIAFSNDVFLKLVPWLMLNQQGLSVLIHPNTNDMVADHRDFPIWLGERLPLDIAFLEAVKNRI